MAKSVWIVSEDLGSEGLEFLGAFTSRRIMFKELEQRYPGIEIHLDHKGLPYYALAVDLFGFSRPQQIKLSLDRRNLDIWKGLKYD